MIWTLLIGPGIVPGLNALLLGTLLYRSRLVPRWIPIFGLVGAPLLISGALARMFGVTDLTSAWSVVGTIPIFVNAPSRRSAPRTRRRPALIRRSP